MKGYFIHTLSTSFHPLQTLYLLRLTLHTELSVIPIIACPSGSRRLPERIIQKGLFPFWSFWSCLECLRAAQSFSATSFYRAANDFSLLPQCGREGDSKRRSAQKRLDVERADAGFVHRWCTARYSLSMSAVMEKQFCLLF